MMNTPDPIDAYLRELRRQLRAPRGPRRRILAEVRTHLLEATEAEQHGNTEQPGAAERALARFGLASDTARQFNRLARHRRRVLRRALLPWAAAVMLLMTSLATATVWASHPGASIHSRTRVPEHHVQSRRCAKHSTIAMRACPVR
jgi:hypothetical protein